MAKIVFRGQGYDPDAITGVCEIEGPHKPHMVGSYPTVRYGNLDQFCRGRQGPGAGFEVIEDWKGSAHDPDQLTIQASDEEA